MFTEYTIELLKEYFPDYDFSNVTQDQIDELNSDIEDSIMMAVQEFLYSLDQ